MCAEEAEATRAADAHTVVASPPDAVMANPESRRPAGRRGLLVVGLNHRTAPIELRERLAISSHQLSDALTSLQRHPTIDEVVILSTCNRVELYVGSSSPPAALVDLTDYLSHCSGLPPSAFRAHLYCLGGDEATAHLFRVTAGLDSMIFGESEVTAQVKQAYFASQAQGTTGPLLNRLFQKALHNAKITRSRTRIAEGQTSIGSVVVALAKQHFGNRLPSCETLLWGAGKAAETTARHLTTSGIRHLWIVNRTQTRAEDLASLCQGRWLSWEQALTHLAHVDIAIVCTQAPHYVIDRSDIESLLPQRRPRPLFLIDLAVPRNVDPAIAQLPGIHLYDIDHLQAIAQAGVSQRRQAREHCEAIVREQVGRFWRRWTFTSQKEVTRCHLVGASSSA